MYAHKIESRPHPSKVTYNKPSYIDWLNLGFQLPPALWNKLFVVGKQLQKEYQPNFVSLLILSYWHSMTGINETEIEKKGAYNVLAVTRALIQQYDDFIDSTGSLNHEFCMSDFKQARYLNTVSYLVQMIDQMPISVRKKRQLCNKICQFRRDQLDVLQLQQSIAPESLGFSQAIDIRESSAGRIGFLMAQILTAPFNISQTTERIVQKAFYHFCNAGQAVDDVADCQTDWQGNHPNIYLASLNEHYEEKLRFSQWTNPKRRFFTVDQIRNLSPNSIGKVERYIHDQSTLIPNEQMRNSILCAYYFPKGIIR